MKWLRENWTKVLLITLLLFIGWGLRSSIESRKDFKAKIEKYETDISLRNDTINDLKAELELEKKKVSEYKGTIVLLEQEAANKEKEIKQKDKELSIEKSKIKELPSTEQVKLLSDNLSNELGEDVELKLKSVKGDTLVELEIKHISAVNMVFVERDYSLDKIQTMNELIEIKNDEIDTQNLLINSHVNSMTLLEKTIVQKDGIISDKDGIINELKKKSRRDKVKYFVAGFIAGGLTGVGLTLL